MPSNHSGTSAIAGAPVNPILLAWTLAWRRRVQRLLARRGAAACLIAIFIMLGLSIAIVAWQLLRVNGATLLVPLLAHALATTVAAAAIGWAATAHSRRGIERQLAQSWLASAPVSARDQLAALRWRFGGKAVVPLTAVLALIAGAGFASATHITGLVAAIAVGYATGAVLGWHFGRTPPRCPAMAFPRLRLARAATSHAASSAPLGRWPFAQWRAAANPGVEARLVGALLLSLPMGIPPPIVLLILAFAVTALAALSLLRAVLVMIPEAAAWLRTTPLDLGAFVRAACLRAGAWQIAFAVLGGAMVHALGASTAVACLLVAAWLGVCVTALASALACRYQRTRLTIELVGIGALLMTLVGFAPLALALVVPALWVWQIIRMRKA